MSYRYWIELPVVVGLAIRSAADIFAGTFMAGLFEERSSTDIDWNKFEYSGLKIQSTPVYWHPQFSGPAYYMYGALMAYWAYFGGVLFFDTIANPGLVFGTLGVPKIVMEMVAYANIFVLYYYAGSYFATGVKHTVTNRDS